MDLYLVEKEITFDYRKFPWIHKSRGSVFQSWDKAVIVANSEEEAKQKFLQDNRETKLICFWKYAVKGVWKVMCKDPNFKVKFHVQKIDDDVFLMNVMEYLTLDELKLYLQEKGDK